MTHRSPNASGPSSRLVRLVRRRNVSASEEDEGIAGAYAEIDDAADGDYHAKALDCLLQNAIDRARYILQHRSSGRQFSPGAGAEPLRPLQRGLAAKNLGDLLLIVRQIIDGEVTARL